MNRSLAWLMGLLLLVPAVLIAYRVIVLGYIFLPSTVERGWQLSMSGFVEPSKNDVTVRVAYPSHRPGQTVIEQEFTSSRLEFDLLPEGLNRFGEWLGRSGSKGVGIGYRVCILNKRQSELKEQAPQPAPFPSWVGTQERRLAERLVRAWMVLDPGRRFHAIAGTTAGLWGTPQPPQEDLTAWTDLVHAHGMESALILLFRVAGLPARHVEGLRLEEQVSDSLLGWVEAWTGTQWECVVPATGIIPKNDKNLLPLVAGDFPAVHVTGGEVSGIRWVLSHSVVSQWQHHLERIRLSNNPFNKWSLFHLPQEFQNTIRILILVPLGALLISLLRNVVGLPTFGIFMPVLMALAFRNTGLTYGLGLFAGIILIGFLVRRGIDWLRLLLVPRLSLILTIVIICIIILALVGNKYGNRELMAVGLLPFVILTMTIERFFIIVEEAGVGEGFRTALGSAVVAVITYLILNHEPLQLVFFMYPELLLVVAAAQILLGRYTGYRLLEFYRFRNLRSSSEK